MNLCNQEYNTRWEDTEKTLIKDPSIQAFPDNKDVDLIINKLKTPWPNFQLKCPGSISPTVLRDSAAPFQPQSEAGEGPSAVEHFRPCSATQKVNSDCP